MLSLRLPLILSLCAFIASPSFAAEKKPPQKDDGPAKVELIDYGGFIGGSFVAEPYTKYDNKDGTYKAGDRTPNAVSKGIVVMFGDSMKDGALFDLDSQRVVCAWVGGAPRLVGWWLDGKHGPTSHVTQTPMFSTEGVGWANAEGSFTDPRADIINPLPRPGPLPNDWSQMHGYYRFGRETVFSYAVAGTEVLESLSLKKQETNAAVERSFTIAPHDKTLTVVLADATGEQATADGVVSAGNPRAILGAGSTGGTIAVRDNRLVLDLPAATAPLNISVLIAGKNVEPATLAKMAAAATAPIDLATKTKGGPSLWPEVLETKGTLGKGTDGYVVDSIGIPEENPWKCWMRMSGVDFFKDGSAAISTLNGDVFVVKGIDDKLEKVTWRRFAAGLHAPLGLKIIDDVVYVSCRDGIVKLQDLDGDGEADSYHMQVMGLLQSPSFHSFVCDLNTDPNGDFIFTVGSAIVAGGYAFQKLTPHMGVILRAAKDGSKIETIATGLRMPNGISVRADGQITCSDNEGVWVPAGPIHWVKEGDFLGVKNTAHGREIHHPQPLCFMPQRFESSACSQVWVTSDRWGPLKDRLIHMSYGKSGLYLVYKEEVDGVVQGGAIRMPVQLTSCGLRGRFNERDGQLYIAGLGLNQTTAVKQGGFDRIRYTGRPWRTGTSLEVLPNGVRLNFSVPLDKDTANDVDNYSIKQWNYRWTGSYGSKWYSVADPEQKTTTGDDVKIKSAMLAADGLSVVLEIPDIKPVHQFAVNAKIASADGEVISTEFMSTIHKVPTK